MKLFKSGMFWLFFLLPMALGITYYYKFASDQYQATAHFTIEKSGKEQVDPLGALTGLPGNVSSTRDALIIKDFIESREVIERTRDDFDLIKLYARDDKDWLSRLEKDSSIEEVIEYWQSKVSVEFDLTSGIVTLGVMAFEPEEAVSILNAVLKESEELVNNLSEKSRQDSLTFARKELKNAETKLKQARTDVREFREKEQFLSPEKNAESKITLVEELEADRARAEAELQSLRLELPENSPKIQIAKYKVSALKQQVTKEKKRSSRSNSTKDAKTMSSIISKFEELITEQGFAEKSYEAALLNIEVARIDATRQQRYLTMIVFPKLPEDPIKPNQPNDYIVLFFACLLLWGILSLILASIRDHAGWL
ncbi:MAG: capsular polysaccharide transport system permease protein [Cocleimonas sp.]|jgi:capsular polysaccharide transport system permease protein